MSSWATGPELMVSTKRMDSSFGKNAANRVEESYGDAKTFGCDTRKRLSVSSMRSVRSRSTRS